MHMNAHEHTTVVKDVVSAITKSMTKTRLVVR